MFVDEYSQRGKAFARCCQCRSGGDVRPAAGSPRQPLWMSSICQAPSVSMVFTSCQPASSEIAPPCTAYMRPVTGQFSIAI